MELAIVMPMLVVLMVGAVDYGRIFYWSMELTAAARAGAQYGALSTSQTLPGMKNAAVAAANIDYSRAGEPLSVSDVLIAEYTCHCAKDDGSLFSETTAGKCGSSSLCDTGTHKVYFAHVKVQKTFTTIAGGVPGIPGSVVLTRETYQRAQ